MFHVPGYYRDISQKLSSVLEDVGVSERIVLKRRRTFLLKENMATIELRLRGRDNSVHYFGSQSEGTTTIGLQSDFDVLMCFNHVNVIEDWVDWKAGAFNVKMIQDENVSPGYCMLQKLYDNVPRPMTEIHDEEYVKLREDMVVLKNSLIDRACPSDNIKNGPSFTASHEGYIDTDHVSAFLCRKMPRVVDTWIQTQTTRGKISPEMKRYIERNPCYIVPVGNTGSSLECLEFRISTSHAERCLMFSFNITQIRCYVLMKMILKSFLKLPHERGLSSFMCKNILLLCIEKTPTESWCASNLLTVLTLCLSKLHECINQKQCPHYIEYRNNLMGRKFSHVLHKCLLDKVRAIIYTNGRALFDITTDDLGRRLQSKLNPANVMVHSFVSPDVISLRVSGNNIIDLAISSSRCHRDILFGLLGELNWIDIFQKLARLFYQGSDLERVACHFLQPLLFSSFGCLLASNSIQQGEAVSRDALTWIHAGLNSDAASGKLKLASMFYAVSDFNGVYDILRRTEQIYDSGLVEAMCNCFNKPGVYRTARFDVYAGSHNELSVRDITAYCVRFLPSEINCIPRELQYELYRSSQDDLLHRHESDNYWMDLAVVDSLPYLYFLQYKTCGHLQRHGDQHRALRNLITVINKQDENFGHRETAWNLAGQCMEQEDRPVDAFQCYVNSLNIRPRNNAANFHMCRLLYSVYCSRVQP